MIRSPVKSKDEVRRRDWRSVKNTVCVQEAKATGTDSSGSERTITGEMPEPYSIRKLRIVEPRINANSHELVHAEEARLPTRTLFEIVAFFEKSTISSRASGSQTPFVNTPGQARAYFAIDPMYRRISP
jgi:hypothetical protein